MRILFLNPFHGGSHAAVAEGYARHSQHHIELLTLPIAGGWRWRMRGAAVTFARMLREMATDHRPPTTDHRPPTTDHRPPTGDQRQETADNEQLTTVDRQAQNSKLKRPEGTRNSKLFDLILATDMLDLATFLGLTRDLTAGIPTAIYFHENQLTYPLPPGRTRDLAFPWINYSSALAADAVCFNSGFHRRAFLDALPSLIGRYHDHQELGQIDLIAAKAQVLPPGIDLARLDPTTDDRQETSDKRQETESTGQSTMYGGLSVAASPVILWNSRWEYDKNPAAFFAALEALEAQGIDFRLIVLGEHVDPNEPSFAAARARFGPRALAWGYAPDTAAYRDLLRQADIVVSTAVQEFFGVSVVEAIYCGCVPILPRRLSYPEILPPEHHAACLYDDQGGLVDKLAAAIRDLPRLKAHGFQALAAQYGWQHISPRYDAVFEEIVRGQ